jgi:hypothetical protein
VGNGTCLAIKNIGTSLLFQPNFILCNVLHVPKITKNLLSVQKFTLDNNAFVEFHPSCFFVKDHISGKILHKGPSKNGLISGPPLHQMHHLVFFPVNVLPLMIGTRVSIILLIKYFIKLCLSFTYLPHLIKSYHFAPYVAVAKVTSFLFPCLITHHMFP